MNVASSRTYAPTAAFVPTISLVVDIISKWMNLRPDQLVIYNQQWRIPPTDGLFSYVGVLGVQPYASSRGYSVDETNEGLLEVVSVSRKETFQFDMFSKNTEALDRNVEPVMALNSDYAERVQEANNFRLASIPLSMVDTSSLEGEGQLTRFTMTFNALRGYTTTRPAPSFDAIPSPALVAQP